MQLPQSVQAIADVIGRDQALHLSAKYPRRHAGTPGKASNRVIFYVPQPRRLRPDNPLVQILGWPDAQKLCAAFGGEFLQPATCKSASKSFRDFHIVRMIREDRMSVADVAELCCVSERHVRNILRAAQENPQMAEGDGSGQYGAVATHTDFLQ